MEEFARIETQETITAIAIAKETLVVGTSEGNVTLHRMTVSTSPDGGVTEEFFEDWTKQIASKKHIDEIRIAEDDGNVYVLCDSSLSALEIYSGEPVWKSKDAKHAACFDVCESFIAFSSKKRILLQDAYENYGTRAEVFSPEACSCLALFSTDVAVVGFKKEYALVTFSTQQLQSLAPIPESVSGPLCVVIPETGEALLRLEDLGQIVCVEEGSKKLMVTRSAFRWTEVPRGVAVSYPFIMALESRCIEIHSMFDSNLNLIDTVPFKDGVAIAASLNGEHVAVASTRKVVIYKPTAPEKIIKKLIQERRIDEAFEVFEKTQKDMDPEEKKKVLSDMSRDGGIQYLVAANFSKAFETFKKSLMDPRDAIAFFKDLVYSSRIPFVPYKPLDIDNIIRAIARSTVTSSSSAVSGSGSGISSSASSNSLSASSAGSSSASGPTGSASNANSSPSVQAQISQLREAARVELRKYLFHCRSRQGVNWPPESYEAVDFALVKVLLESAAANANDMLLSLLRDKNSCPQECENLLRNANKMLALGFLQKSRGRLRDALQIWKDMSDVDAAQAAIDSLVTENQLPFIWTHGKWVFDKFPLRAVKIFALNPAHAKNAGEILDRLRVYGSEVVIAFLESLVKDEARQDAFIFHTELAVRYIEIAQNLKVQLGPALQDRDSKSRIEAGSEPGMLGETRTKLLFHLQNSKMYDAGSVLSALKGTDLWEELVVVYTKAQMWTEALRGMVYHLENFEGAEKFCVDRKIPLTALLEVVVHEEARVFSLLDRHATRMDPCTVLRILPDTLPINKMKDYLSRVVAHANAVKNDRVVVKNLAKGSRMEIEYTRMCAVSRRAVIGENKMCGVCKKRINENHFVAVYPNLRVVHYSCHKNVHIDPVDGRDFRTDSVRFQDLDLP
eukprot:ANDGO_07554.mRNA.1 hypothetical protein